MTTSIAQFMRDLERAWDAHREALLVRRDLAAALAPMAAEPTVVHIPAMTGAAGRPAVERFYADEFLPYVPGDLALSTISGTVDRWRIRSQRVLWDHATLVGQLGLQAEVTGRAASGPAR